MDQAAFQRYLAELATRYGMSGFHVLDTIEKVMGEVLETRYRQETIHVSIDAQTLEVEITAYSRTQGGHQRVIDLKRLSGIRNLQKHIETELEQQHTVALAKRIEATCKHRVFEGLVRKVTASGSLWVEIGISENVTVTGWCPANHLIPSEVGMVRPGQRMKLYLKRVNTVPIDGMLRLHLVFDRTSKSFLEEQFAACLRPSMPHVRVTCRKRQPGLLSEVWSNEFIPKNIRDAISRELGGEKILIFVGKNREEIVAVRRRLTKQARQDHRIRSLPKHQRVL